MKPATCWRTYEGSWKAATGRSRRVALLWCGQYLWLHHGNGAGELEIGEGKLMKLPIDSALGAAQRIVDRQRSGHEIPAVGELVEAVRSFEPIEFDVPSGTDSDGFLFQYGEVNWFCELTFTIGFVRQLELAGPEGEPEGYSQVQLEYRYRVDAHLRSLGDHNSWWFREGGTPFADWLESVATDPVWRVVRDKAPVGFDISQKLA